MSTDRFFKKVDQTSYTSIAYGPSLNGIIDPLEDITEAKDQVKQNFRMLLLTRPGERITDSNFGVGIQNFLFELANVQTQGQIKTRITNQVSVYMPYITIKDIRVGLAEPNSQALRVIVQYYIPSLDVLDQQDLVFPT